MFDSHPISKDRCEAVKSAIEALPNWNPKTGHSTAKYCEDASKLMKRVSKMSWVEPYSPESESS